MLVGFIGWIVLGLSIGSISNALANKRDRAIICYDLYHLGIRYPFAATRSREFSSDMLFGAIGATAGGVLVSLLSASSARGLSLESLLVATGGSVLFVSVWQAMRRPADGARLQPH